MRGATFRHSLNGAAAISVTLLFIANPPDCESEPEGESGDKRDGGANKHQLGLLGLALVYVSFPSENDSDNETRSRRP